jgi:predicted ArsR family transcriptional regulator
MTDEPLEPLEEPASAAVSLPPRSLAGRAASHPSRASQASRASSGDAVGAIALLDEPKRRRLYEYVTSRPEPVGRDEAASALGFGRELAAFHLDRLAAAGLLDVEYRRLGERRGPGAGRPSKLYRRSSREVSVSLPARDYERLARMLAEAIERDTDAEARVAADRLARTRGEEEGDAARRKAGTRPGRSQLRAGLIEILGEDGYEPATDAAGAIRLQNCPYHALSATHRDLTCGMNLAWAEGVLEGLGGAEPGASAAGGPGGRDELGGLGGQSAGAHLEAELAPEAGYCCVVFRDTEAGPDPRR